MTAQRFERLYAGVYQLTYRQHTYDPGSVILDLNGPYGLHWDVTVTASPELMALIEGDVAGGVMDPITRRLKAALVSATVPIVRERIVTERLPCSRDLDIVFTERQPAIAWAVNSRVQRLDLPDNRAVVLNYEHQPRSPEFRSSGSGAKPGFVAQNRDPAGSREFQTLGDLQEFAFAARNPILSKSRKNGTPGLSDESGFGRQNRVLPGKPENESLRSRAKTWNHSPKPCSSGSTEEPAAKPLVTGPRAQGP